MMKFESFLKIYRLGIRLMGYGIIAIGLSAAFLGYTDMLVRLNDQDKPDELWKRITRKH